VLKALRAYGPRAADELVAALAEQGRAIRTATVEAALGEELLAFEIERARGHHRAAGDGIGLLAPSSRPAIRTALLYGEILD
jgi:phytoene/squalene synthetase